MKVCPNCRSEVDDNFDICWQCQYCFSEERIIAKNEFSEKCPNCNADVDPELEFCPNCSHELGINAIPYDPTQSLDYRKIDCLRCKTPMISKGNSKFHEGTPYGVYGNLFELMTNRESFDIYYCPQCGKVEFFLPKVNESEE